MKNGSMFCFNLGGWVRLPHDDGDLDGLSGGGEGQDIALNGLAVDGDALHALLHGSGVLDLDVVHGAAVTAGDREAGQGVGNAGVDLQAVQRGLHAEDVLAHVEEGPRGGAGQPTVLRLAEGGSVLARDHLAVDVGLGAVDLGDVLNVAGQVFL